jgi:hypothetical protein
MGKGGDGGRSFYTKGVKNAKGEAARQGRLALPRKSPRGTADFSSREKDKENEKEESRCYFFPGLQASFRGMVRLKTSLRIAGARIGREEGRNF